jgi:photosystem II stability/assembly factor-like uncharacterized protein
VRVVVLVAALMLGVSGSGASAKLRDTWVPLVIAFWNESEGLVWSIRAFDCAHEQRCAELARTDDGGRSWRPVYRNEAVGEIAVARDTRAAWLVEGNCDYWVVCRPRLLRSVDRGRSWRRIGRAVINPSFATARIGFGTLYDKHEVWSLMRTRDGGKSWSAMRSPCGGPSVGPWGSPSPWFLTARVGWVLCKSQPGAGSQLKAVLRTRDGGRSWHMVMSAGWSPAGGSSPGAVTDAGYAQGIAFGGGRGWLWQRGSFSYTSLDGGRTWTVIPFTRASGNGIEIEDLSPVSRDVAFVLVNLTWKRRELRRTDDGGRTWRVSHVWRYR